VRSGGTLVDVGCGQGLLLALLAESAAAWRAGHWPAGTPGPPLFDALVGIELRARAAAIARAALGADATIVDADARRELPQRSSAIAFFDVLHMMPAPDQETLLAAAAAALDRGGAILVREPDRAAGWSFAAVRAGNSLKAFVTGNWSQRFHYRTTAEWTGLFERLGFEVDRRGTGEGTPFANELFVLTARERASA
jgi:SAM-dependent methyltransferase